MDLHVRGHYTALRSPDSDVAYYTADDDDPAVDYYVEEEDAEGNGYKSHVTTPTRYVAVEILVFFFVHWSLHEQMAVHVAVGVIVLHDNCDLANHGLDYEQSSAS